jgi:DNA gyrase subunit A
MFEEDIHPINVEEELKRSYLDYSMSVIVGRALPDVRDGLKPVHRRILYAMYDLNNDWNKPYKKSARVVGDVIGKYHPHGDTAVYDTMVRMAQSFSMRYVLVDGQGNFGSVDGDAAAAMRYTEVRMSKLAHQLLIDLEKDTVDFAPNYDGSEQAPVVFPTRIPQLLVNGSSGIAVGMATNIPPHNLREVISACLALIDNPDIELDDLMRYIPGPDFPTKAMMYGGASLKEAYRTGRGRVVLRARTFFETDKKTDKTAIIVSELPYQVNKARLIEKIAELVKEKKVEGITGLRDESDKDGMRIVIELRRGENEEVLLRQLYAHTSLETAFGLNMVALVDKQPKTLGLKAILEAFIRHRREVVYRRAVFECRKARQRAHILEGLAVALANVDPMIVLIKSSPNAEIAKTRLMETEWPAGSVVSALLQKNTVFLSAEQAQAILDLRLQRLTGLEQDKIFQEYRSLLSEIEHLEAILANHSLLMQVVRDELATIFTDFGDARCTEIIDHYEDCVDPGELIAEETRVVTLSQLGYIKTQPVSVYSAQRRGGRGKQATGVREEDTVVELVIASTHDTIMCFSTFGKVYCLKVYMLPVGSREAKGKPINNVLSLDAGESISALLAVSQDNPQQYIVMATKKGVVKRVLLSSFSRPRSNGLIAVALDDDDTLVSARTTDGESSLLLCTNTGKSIRFLEADLRVLGRTARGVRGIQLSEGQFVIALIIVDPQASILLATAHGFGKRTMTDAFPVQGRAGQGVIAIQTSERNGEVIGAIQVAALDEVMLISDQGVMVRTSVSEISVLGRNTQGVRLIQLADQARLAGIQRVMEEDVEEVLE